MKVAAGTYQPLGSGERIPRSIEDDRFGQIPLGGWQQALLQLLTAICVPADEPSRQRRISPHSITNAHRVALVLYIQQDGPPVGSA
ncbi:MAG: hypothetical protein R2867_31985 [Caldilineaceae bacterium]